MAGGSAEGKGARNVQTAVLRMCILRDGKILREGRRAEKRRRFGKTPNSIRTAIRHDRPPASSTRPLVRQSTTSELQPSGILVDENGDWYHNGNKIFRPEILEILYSRLDQLPTGEFVLADSRDPAARCC